MAEGIVPPLFVNKEDETMSKALIQVVNGSTQAVSPADNAPAFVSLGNVVRRYGDNLRLNGNAIEQVGSGYYEIEGTITVAPTEAGTVTVALFENGVVMPGSMVSGVAAAANDPVTLPLLATARIFGCGCGTSAVTVGVMAGVGNVTNVSVRDTKA